MLGAETKSDRARGKAAQYGELSQQLQCQGQLSSGRLLCQGRTEKPLMSKNLNALRHARRKFTALLNLREQLVSHGIPDERIRQ
jgi:hypothetical protein